MAQVEMSNLHLLVVDDESYTRDLIARVLHEVNTGKISTAADGYEALAVMREERWLVDAVLLDLEMPNMNGYAFVEKMRSELEPPLSETPIIIISGHSDEKAICVSPCLDGFDRSHSRLKGDFLDRCTAASPALDSCVP